MNQKHYMINSSFLNVALPKFLKHMFLNTIFFLFLYLIYFLLNIFLVLDYNLIVIFILLLLTILLSLFKISKELIDVMTTKYYFYEHYLEKKVKIVTETVHSISYSKITNVEITKDLWDRICGVGNIYLHTANDTYQESNKVSGIVIKDIRDPEKIRDFIIRKMSHNHR